MNETKLLTIAELAALLDVSERYVMDRAAAGDIPSLKLGRLRRFRQSDIDVWLEKQATGTEAA